jgi:hypothetical protein
MEVINPFGQIPALKLLFSNMDLSLTVSLVEAKYAKGGRERPPFPVRSMLFGFDVHAF